MALIESIAAQGFAGLLANLASSYLTNRSNRISSNKDEISTDISSNLNAAYEKCTKIKTILSDEIVSFLNIYSDQNFSCDGKNIDQYDLVEKVRRGTSIIISGTGGGGKSMFMRYLWLSYFEDPRGKIPFFLELRQLNRLTHDRIEDFIFHSIIQSGSKINQSSFEKALHSGHFIIFLDGFDEINHDKRQAIEEKILSLKANHPGLTVVVTSRPDDRFRGWHQFSIVKVEPLDKEKSIRLIERAPFDKNKISKIINKMKDGLYESHRSFLSNPLLSYMLLVTFSYNPDIPRKMFLFYEQAFEALYHRHDLTKGGYSRRFYLNIDKQNFIRQISYFCLLSYYDEAFEFREEVIRNYLMRARDIEKLEYDISLLLNDIMESVCLIKKEGFEYSFTHRSFQEYFAAYCISRVASRNVEKVFEKFSQRYNDQVLGMVYDINKDLFREKYIIPMRNKYKNFYNLKREETITVRFFYDKFSVFTIRSLSETIDASGRKLKRPPKDRWQIDLHTKGNFDSFDRNIQRITDDYFSEEQDISINVRRDRDDYFSREIFRHFGNEKDIFEVKSDGVKFLLFRNGALVENGIEDFQWHNSYMYSYFRFHAMRNHRFVNKEEVAYDRVSSSFEEFFN